MPKVKLQLELVTPLFSGGADPRGKLELRAAPIRGELRYWLRALLGAQGITGLDALQARESAVFGNTQVGSPITVRVRAASGSALKQEHRSILPHSNDPKKNHPVPAFKENQLLELELVTRPGRDLPLEALQALGLWLNFGGLGKRARRGFGSLQLRSLDVDGVILPPDIFKPGSIPLPANGAALAAQLQAIASWALTGAVSLSTYPDFPTLAHGQSRIVVCQQALPVGVGAAPPYEQAMVAFWRVLRSPALLSESAYGYAGVGGRRASPVHFHLARSQAGYHWVLTALVSNPSPASAAGWTLVDQLLDACSAACGGVDIWK